MRRALDVQPQVAHHGPMDDVTREVVLDAAPDEVWEVVTSPDQLAEWFGADVDGEIAPGEVVRFTSPDGAVRRALDRAHGRAARAGFRWLPSATEPPSRVDITIDPAHDGSVLRVTSGGSRPSISAEPRIGFHALARRVSDFGSVFDALGDPTRRRVLADLSALGEASCTDLSRGMPISRQAVSKHLNALMDAGLVSTSATDVRSSIA